MTSQSGQSKTASPNISTSDRDWEVESWVAIGTHKAQQQADELAVLLSYLAAVTRPSMVIELGLGDGGLAWALKRLPSQPTVLSVSLPDPQPNAGNSLPDLQHHVIWGDTHDPATRHAVESWLGTDRADVLVIDADHTYESAKRDWADYEPFVRPGGLVVFHDIARADNYPLVQVHRLWAELRGQHRTLEIVAEPTGLAGTGLLWVPE